MVRSETDQKVEITGEKAEKVKIKNSNGKLKMSLKFPDLSADGKVLIKLYHKSDIQVIDGNEGASITGKDIDADEVARDVGIVALGSVPSFMADVQLEIIANAAGVGEVFDAAEVAISSFFIGSENT